MGNNQKIRIAAIGVGSLGQHHARNLSELAQQGKVTFVGVCDLDAAAGKTVSIEHGCQYFGDWRDLLGMVDAVTIATPTETHSEIACAFLNAGVHALVEKPIALTLSQADQIISAADGSKSKLMIGQLERYNPAMVALRPLVTKPMYFEIHRVSPFPNRSLDVDVVLDVMIHDLDAIRWLVGASVDVKEVRAVGLPVISDKVDAANARIEFANGAVANVTASRIGTEKIRKTRFYQTGSYVVLDYANKFTSLTSIDPDAPNTLQGITINRPQIADVEPLKAEISAFLDCIANDTTPPITGEDGRRALELAVEVVRQIEKHQRLIKITV